MHDAAAERLFVVALDARGGGGRVPGLLVGGVVGVVARRDTDRMTDDDAAAFDAEATEGYAEATVRPR